MAIKAGFRIYLILILLLAVNAYAENCNYAIDVMMNSTSFTSEEFEFRLRALKIEGGQTKITGTARIEDSSGRTIKSYKPWTNESITIRKTSAVYTPNLKSGGYRIISSIRVDCDDTFLDDNSVLKEFSIVGYKDEEEEENPADEQATATTSMSTTTTLPIINQKTPTSTVSTTTKIELLLDPPKGIENTNVNKNVNKKKAQNQIATAVPVNSGKTAETAAKKEREARVVYESDFELVKKTGIALLIMLSILLNIVLIWKR